MHPHQNVEARFGKLEEAAAEVERFARDQLLWFARRGPPERRQDARALAEALPRLVAEARAAGVLRALRPAVECAPSPAEEAGPGSEAGGRSALAGSVVAPPPPAGLNCLSAAAGSEAAV